MINQSLKEEFKKRSNLFIISICFPQWLFLYFISPKIRKLVK